MGNKHNHHLLNISNYNHEQDCYNTCTSGVLSVFSQSDHYPIFTTRTVVKKPKPKTEITRRNHSNKNISFFKKNLLRRQIGRNYMISPILIQHLHFFSNYMTNTFQKCFPKETIKINHKNKNPWINQTLRKEVKDRDKLYWISRKHPTTENKEIYKKF